DATGANESLKQSQRLLQQAKQDNSEALGKIAALEKELCAFRDTKEEKLSQAESTIETLSQHVTELSESDSMSRARREHEAVVSTLTQRHQRELLVLKEQLDVTKAELSTKTQELSQAREQLGEATLALEQAQVSRGETVNRLSRSLEESQRRCQELLQQLGADSAAREVATLKVKLQQSQESTRISEELCRSYQEAREQLSMLEAATTLGAINSLSSATSTSGRVPQHAPSADDSMTDLGIRRTLDFSGTPQSEGRCERSDQPPVDDDLVSSLRSELERCLRSNREKRSEVTELRGEVKSLTSELEKAKGQVSELEKICTDQRKRLSELGDLMGGEDSGIGAVEARLKRDLDKMVREKQALLDDIKDYQQRLEEVGASEAQLTEINAELSQQMSAMVARGDQDKADALARCQRTMEETGRITLENLRREMEERHAAETETLTGRGEKQLAELRQQLSSALKELDDVKALYVNVCQESAAQEAELTDKFKQQLEAETRKIEDRVELEKKEWREFIREEVRKEEDESKETAEAEKLNQLEAELEAKWEKQVELKAAQVRLETLQEQRKLVEEERQEWEKRRNEMEDKLKKRVEEISQLTSQLEEAREEIDSLKEELRKMSEANRDEKKEEDGLIKTSEDSKEVEQAKEDLEETLKALDVSTLDDSSLVSMSIASGKDQEITGMKTLQPAEDLTLMSMSIADCKEGETTLMKTMQAVDEDPTLVSMSITACENSDGTIMETMQADPIHQVVDSIGECRDMKHLEDIATKLREKEKDLEGLTKTLQWKCEELERKGEELEELRRKGTELEEALQQKESELVDLREKLRLQASESEQEVGIYRRKMAELEAEVEKSRLLIGAQAIDSEFYNSSEARNLETKRDDQDRSVGDTKHSVIFEQGEGHDLDIQTPEQLRDVVKKLQEKLKSETDSHAGELERQKDVHRIEFERAARQREEKFQSELRYFLKEREERGKTRMEEAVRECREKCEEEFGRTLRQREEKTRGDFEASLRDLRRTHEDEKRELERAFQRKLEEGKQQWREKKDESQGVKDCVESEENNVLVKSLTEDLRIERRAKEELRLLVEDKDGQIVTMALRQEEEEKALREKFEREMGELRDVYGNQIKKLEEELDVQRKKFEDVSRESEISARAKTTVEVLKLEAELEKKLESKVRKDVEDRIRKEMEVEMEGKVKEMEREAKGRGRTHEEYSIAQEVEKRLSEKLQEERGKWFKDAEDYISSEVRREVEDRKREEEDKRKEGFDKEVEDKVKWRLEEERARLGKELDDKVKERVKEKMDAEMTNLKKKFTTELGARIGMEKSRLEQEVAEWKTRATREIERDREKWTKDMTAKMMEEREKWVRERKTQVEKTITEERKKLESELRTARDQEIADLRKELEAEMRKRISKEREVWKEELQQEEQDRREENDEEGESKKTVSTMEKLKSEVEARTKACAERDRAIAYIRDRETSYKEERQRLLSGLERCRSDLEGMKEEHRELEEKCAAMDRRYKEDMKSARRRREEDLQNLRKSLEHEKNEAVALWEEKVQALREECSNAVERARGQGEMEKALLLAEVQRHTERALEKSSLPIVGDTDSSTILELRDHYLDTVAKIKADVMSHVQEANKHAAATMRAQIRKQKVKVIEEFKLKVKACLKAALTGEVPTSCITALENSIDALAVQLLSSAPSSSSSSGNTPRSGHDLDKPQMISDLGKYDFADKGVRGSSSPNLATAFAFQDEDRDVLRKEKKYTRGPSPKRVTPPEKDMDKCFSTFDAEYDDDAWEYKQKEPLAADTVTPVVQRSKSQAQRDLRSRTPPRLPGNHPQLEGVDLFDTSISQHTMTPPQMSRTHSNKTGVSPVRKSRPDQKSNFPSHQHQQYRSPHVPSTAGTKGGDTTPVSSNASSPRASPTLTHPRDKSSSKGDGDLRLDLDLGIQSPFVTMTRGSGERDEDRASSKRPSRETSKVSEKWRPEVDTSPRDQMKVVEARVRLANWAKSGQAPWSPSITLEKPTPFSSEKADPTFAEEYTLEHRTFPWEEGGGDSEIKQQEHNSRGDDDVMTREGFRVPGPEAEKWVRSQKRVGVKRSEYRDKSGRNQELSNLMSYTGSDKNRPIHSGDGGDTDVSERVGILKAVVMVEDQFVSSDESVASNASHSSLVTLEPEEKNLAASGLYKQSVGVVGVTGDRSRGKGLAGSLGSQNPGDSGLPRSTRTVNTSSGSGQERGVSPYRKERRGGSQEATGEARSRDYERIRAAVLRGGGTDLRDRINIKDGINLGVGVDNTKGSTTSSDDEMSLEDFKTFPSKSAERYVRPKFTMPTSTPLVKNPLSTEPRAWSDSRAEFRRAKGQRGKAKGEGKRGGALDEDHFERDPAGVLKNEWRHLGGRQILESDRYAWEDIKDKHKDLRHDRSRSGEGPSPLKSGSLPQHSRRGRSHDQGRRDDLVLRSVDQLPLTSSAFPSDLSRITHASGKTDDSGPGMWRYRSLEDLIGGRGDDSDRLRVYRDMEEEEEEMERRENDDRNRKGRELRSNSRERRDFSNQSFGGHSTSTAWYDQGSSGKGPVKAMNSDFWERQRSEQDELDEEEEEGQERGRRNLGGKAKRNSKMQRSTSEQSLHSLHGTGSHPNQGRAVDGVDALLAHYLSPAKSSFDLRPFAREEHF
ncbi:centrosomal protein of 152 kDa-like, partial [Elysia marginata]